MDIKKSMLSKLAEERIIYEATGLKGKYMKKFELPIRCSIDKKTEHKTK
jgi:hypothetical protein